VRALTWNTGCAYGSTYKRANDREWQQVAAWTPDVALLQEVMRPPSWVPASEVAFTPYDFSDQIGTAIVPVLCRA
jgi:endonuclease/exonuclease/phosphatase family metal-dependent hydrolase